MTHRAKQLFRPEARERVAAAVREAETRTRGEIVPLVVPASDPYEAAAWKGATLGALGSAALAAAWQLWSPVWGVATWIWIALPVLVGAGVGFSLGQWVPPIKRWLIPRDVLDRQTRQRAEGAFLAEEVFHTRERTGILLFVSLFERRVVVLADSGIHASAPPEEWGAVVDLVTSGIRAGRAAEALIEGIRRCGELLETRGVAARPDDFDELSDQLRWREE